MTLPLHAPAALLAASTSGSGGGGLLGFLPLVVILVGGYFLLQRQGKKRQAQAQQVRAALEPGARVLLGSGFLATVEAVRDDEVDVLIAPGVTATVVPQAVARVVEPVPGPDGSHEALDEPGEPQP